MAVYTSVPISIGKDDAVMLSNLPIPVKSASIWVPIGPTKSRVSVLINVPLVMRSTLGIACMIGLEAMVFGLSATLAIPLAVSELPILGTTGSCRSSAWIAVR